MKIERVTEGRFDEVIQHLRRAFFADEPLNMAVQLGQQGHCELEKLSLSTLRQNLSLMAVDGDEILGVALNGILVRGDLEKSEKSLEAQSDERFKKIFKFLYSQNIQSNIFEELRVDKIFEIRILSVDPRCRGQGIAKQLLEESELVAGRNGFSVMKADATGLFSQKISSSLGFKTLVEVRYDSYIEDGVPVFRVAAPHVSLKIMYKCIN